MQTAEIRHLYNDAVQDKFQGSYEFERWAKTPILRTQFYMTRSVIRRLLRKTVYKRVLELGPGPGTWTREILKRSPHAHIDAIDISSAMLSQARASLYGKGFISFYETDFLNFRTRTHYDLFFSSRVIEYFNDKRPVIEKIKSSLKSGGIGIVITKMPHNRGKRLGKMHGMQIEPQKLRKLLWDAGFKDVKLYPVTLNFPLLKSSILSKILFALFAKLPLNPVSAFFAESYSAYFRKA